MAARVRLIKASLGTTAIHGLLVGVILITQQCPPPTLTAAPLDKEEDKYAQLKAIRETVQLPEPPKEEPPKEEPPKEEPPKEEPPKEEPTPKKKKKKRAKKPRPKQKKAQKSPEPAEPAPLVLENVNIGSGGVNVQQGERDIFGDPSVAANERNTQPGADTGGTDDEDEAGSDTSATLIRPKPKSSSFGLKGRYPDDAPRLGRKVSVVLSLKIDKKGNVNSVTIAKSAGKAFDREARRIGKRLKFKPASRGGRPVDYPYPIRWTVDFEPP